MADGIEMIESRLAAYIDGELPDADRAEIEKYLAANPSHRQLIAELKQQKLTIAALPRESAPVEVLDHLQSHLERQALLDNVEDGADSMRINRWPQWTAVAAMLLLTVGLGALVFSVLPGGALNHDTVAIAPPSMQNLPAAPSLDAKEEAESRDAVASVGEKAGDASEASPKFSAKPGATADDADMLAAKKSDDANVLTNELRLSKANGGSLPDPSTLALNNGSAIVVSTDDPLITQNLLAGYLGQNNYEYTPVRAEVAKASITQSGSAVQQFSDQPTTQSVMQQAQAFSRSESSQQAIGSVVERLNAKDKVAVDAEQYLLVRNVSPADAERINSVINSQRGLRQQSRFYGNRDLYPELNQQNQQAYNDNQKQQLQESESKVAGAAREIPTEPRQRDAKPEGADDGQLGAGPSEQQRLSAPITPEAPAPTTLPAPAAATTELAARTDVLIIVRNDPALEPNLAASQPALPQTPPSTQPSTQPATQPSSITAPLDFATPPVLVTPDAPLAPPATQPAP